jgi:hypothetical protein
VIYKPLVEIFGKVSKMSDDNQAKFLLAIWKTGSFEPNWKATSEDLGVANRPRLGCYELARSRFSWATAEIRE